MRFLSTLLLVVIFTTGADPVFHAGSTFADWVGVETSDPTRFTPALPAFLPVGFFIPSPASFLGKVSEGPA